MRGFHQGTRAKSPSMRCRIYDCNLSFMYTAIFPLQCGADHIWLDGVSDALAYALRRSLSLTPAAIRPRLRLPGTTRPRFALHGAQRGPATLRPGHGWFRYFGRTHGAPASRGNPSSRTSPGLKDPSAWFAYLKEFSNTISSNGSCPGFGQGAFIPFPTATIGPMM